MELMVILLRGQVSTSAEAMATRAQDVYESAGIGKCRYSQAVDHENSIDTSRAVQQPTNQFLHEPNLDVWSLKVKDSAADGKEECVDLEWWSTYLSISLSSLSWVNSTGKRT